MSGDVYDVRNDILDGQFSLYEVECAIKHLKSGKATGPDYIRNEYITYEKQNLKHVLRELFNVIYETGAYPDQWSTGVIVPIYKKGDTNDPANYRGITLTCAMSKLFTFMLNKRINEWAEQSDLFSQAQFAYKTGYSTTDAVFVLNAVLSSSGGCCGFIDFSKAFDNVNRETLFKTLKQLQISSKLLNLIQNMHSKLKCQVRTSSGESDMFPQSNGVMQGECLSPTLFTAYINEIERLMNDIDEMGVYLNGVKVSVIMYADDLVLISKTKHGLQIGMNALYGVLFSKHLNSEHK